MQAYDKLLLKDAAQLLKFKTQQELVQFCNVQGWKADAQYVRFGEHGGGGKGDQESIGAFHNMLTYARELDRII